MECFDHTQLMGWAMVMDYVVTMWSGMIEMRPFNGGGSVYFIWDEHLQLWCKT